MSGVRVNNRALLELGLTLPGFVDRGNVIASLPSLGLLTIAAHTPEHWDIGYSELDAITEEDIRGIIDERADIVALSSLTARIYDTYQLAARLRAGGICVVIGGLHVSAMPEEALAYADCVIQGEGEHIWPVLLSDFEQGRLQTIYSSLRDRKLSFDLHCSRVPRYDLLDISKYNRLTIQTTRGCPLHCSFCAASRTISAYKKKPISQIRQELDRIFEIWDRPFIELADDNTFVDKQWSKELLGLFSQYPMKWFTETDISVAYDDELLELLAQSHCAQVLIGFETSSALGLKGLDRNDWKYRQFDNYHYAIDKIQSYGISVNGCFILGFDSDTAETFKETERFILESNLSEVQITLLTPFPGTALYQQMQSEGRLLQERQWDRCTLFDVTYQPRNFSVSELEHHFALLMKSVYSAEAVADRKYKFREAVRNRIKSKII